MNIINSVTKEVQTVAINQNVLFNSNRVRSCANYSIRHDEGSGLFTLTQKGIYRVHFNGNVTSAVVGDISLAIEVNGESISGGIINEVVAVANDEANVSVEVLVSVPCNCCMTVSVGNISTENAILVDNANIIIEKLGF